MLAVQKCLGYRPSPGGKQASAAQPSLCNSHPQAKGQSRRDDFVFTIEDDDEEEDNEIYSLFDRRMAAQAASAGSVV